MALNWKTVSADHVRAALNQVAASKSANRKSELIVVDGDRTLPAKEVLRVAYRLANKLPSDAPVKFSSGDGTLSVLRKLGFQALRTDAGANNTTPT